MVAKPNIALMLARAKARLANQPEPIDPAIVHTVLPVATANPTPLAEFLADAIPPETEWEKAYRRSQEMAPAQAKGRGPNLHVPYSLRGKVEMYKLSEAEPSQDASFQAAKARQAAEAKAKDDEPYKGTVQERIALSHIRAKQARLQKLTHAEKRLLSKFNMAVFVARAGLNKRKPNGE